MRSYVISPRRTRRLRRKDRIFGHSQPPGRVRSSWTILRKHPSPGICRTPVLLVTFWASERAQPPRFQVLPSSTRSVLGPGSTFSWPVGSKAANATVAGGPFVMRSSKSLYPAQTENLDRTNTDTAKAFSIDRSWLHLSFDPPSGV